MYYIKFGEDGMQEESKWSDEALSGDWHPVGEDISGKFFQLKDGLPSAMTVEEFADHMQFLGRKSIFDSARLRRDQALGLSDWTQLESSPLSAEKKAEWEAYRVALRNYPELLENDINAPFPAEPQ